MTGGHDGGGRRLVTTHYNDNTGLAITFYRRSIQAGRHGVVCTHGERAPT